MKTLKEILKQEPLEEGSKQLAISAAKRMGLNALNILDDLNILNREITKKKAATDPAGQVRITLLKNTLEIERASKLITAKVSFLERLFKQIEKKEARK